LPGTPRNSRAPPHRQTLPMKSVLASKVLEVTEAATSRPEHFSHELAAVSPYPKIGQGRTGRWAPMILLGTARSAGRPDRRVLDAVTSCAGLYIARRLDVTGHWTSRLISASMASRSTVESVHPGIASRATHRHARMHPSAIRHYVGDRRSPRPSGSHNAYHAGDRGAVPLDPGASQSPAYQPDAGIDDAKTNL
jgi:hypothetical protein